MTATVTHVGFADESHWNTGRFRSLGLLTSPRLPAKPSSPRSDACWRIRTCPNSSGRTWRGLGKDSRLRSCANAQ